MVKILKKNFLPLEGMRGNKKTPPYSFMKFQNERKEGVVTTLHPADRFCIEIKVMGQT